MTINTKFDVNQIVWIFIVDRGATKAVQKRVQTIEPGDISKHGTGVNLYSLEEIEEGLVDGKMDLYENQIFDSKESLMKSL